MGSYKGYGPRHPENRALVGGVVDPSRMTPEYLAVRPSRMRGYVPPDILGAAEQPFVGVTTGGEPIQGLYQLDDEGFDCRTAVTAANDLIAVLDERERGKLTQDLESDNWRRWTNAFPAWEPHGLRLEDLATDKREAVLAVIGASLSHDGYQQAREVMRLNRELGRLLDQYHDTLTEWVYWFSLFGEPSKRNPWGWQLYGHHLDLNCMIVGPQMVLTPSFMGAELESEIVFAGERTNALELVNALSVEQRNAAIVYSRFADIPHELQGPIDGRHVGGAGQDNRIVPYEGLPASALGPRDRELFLRLVEAWLSRLQPGPAQAAAGRITSHMDQTHFSWYGPTEGDSAFYYRIHSPVVLIEYDNHPGIFLDNDEPEPFHVHTVVRTPNGNDYGKDLLRQHLSHHDH